MNDGKYLWITLVLLLTAAIVLPPILPPYWVMLLTQTLIYAIAAMALDLLIGYTDMASLGQAGFLAIGAYAAAILFTRYGFGFTESMVAAVLLATVSSAILGLLALRASGVYFLMITLAIAMVIWGLIYRWVSMTGGDNGISGIMRPDLFGQDMFDPVKFFYFIFVFFLVCLALMMLFIRSPFGKTLIGIKDSETRMIVLGYNVWLHKYAVFIIAGAFSGVAGGLYAFYNGFVNPNLSDLAHCMAIVLMVTIGGPGTLIGPIIGAFIIIILENIVSIYTERWVMVLAAIYVITALYAPDGILGWIGKLMKSERAA